MRDAFNKFLSDEDRAGTLVIGYVTALMVIGLAVAVGLISFMR